MTRVPILSILGAILFMLAGIFAYLRVGLSFALPVVFIIGGAGLILIALAGHRPRGIDIVIFVVGLLVFGGVTSSLAIPPSQQVSFSATKAQTTMHTINLDASTNTGSITVLFSNNPNLGYEVNFTGGQFVFFFPIGELQYTFANRTIGDTLFLNASSPLAGITVVLGSGYSVNMKVHTNTGSVQVDASGGKVDSAYLSTDTGSIDANIDSPSIAHLQLSTTTGSVHLKSNSLAPSARGVPVSISTVTGSIDVDIAIQKTARVNLSASTSFGGISQSLSGFSITQSGPNLLTATAGDPGSPTSFVITISANTGSVNLRSRLIG